MGLAEGMREHHGVPFVEGSFYSISSASRTLLALAHLLAERGGPPDMPGQTQALVAREEARDPGLLLAYCALLGEM